MKTYVALIRGIGPGNPNKTNQKLCEVLEGLGLENVRPVISSGNIIFESEKTDTNLLESEIETAWPKMLGFNASTIVRSHEQLQDMLDVNFFDGLSHSQASYLLMTFLKTPSKNSLELPYREKGKHFKVLGIKDDVVYAVNDSTATKTPELMAWLEKQFGKEITSRTPLTVQRIIQKMEK